MMIALSSISFVQIIFSEAVGPGEEKFRGNIVNKTHVNPKSLSKNGNAVMYIKNRMRYPIVT